MLGTQSRVRVYIIDCTRFQDFNPDFNYGHDFSDYQGRQRIYGISGCKSP